MKIGGKYRLEDVGRYQFRKLAIELDLDEDAVLSRIQGMALRLPDHAAALLRRMRRAGLEKDFLGQLADALIARAKVLGHAWTRSRDVP